MKTRTVYVCNVQTEIQKEIPLDPPVMNFEDNRKKKKSESSQADAGNNEGALDLPVMNFQGAN